MRNCCFVFIKNIIGNFSSNLNIDSCAIINFINAITYFADSGLQMDIWFDLQKILPSPADYPINKTKEYRLWKKRV